MGVTIEEVLRALLSNWYNIIYTVELDGDRIQTMSPGKKAIVLLKLLISLADAECPILIDQPEDDLDNRSIYDELVYYNNLDIPSAGRRYPYGDVPGRRHDGSSDAYIRIPCNIQRNDYLSASSVCKTISEVFLFCH